MFSTISNVKETVSSTVSDATGNIPMISTLNELDSFLKGGVGILPKSFRFETLAFDTGTAVLNAGSEFELDMVANAMKENPAILARLEGYTDNIGAESVNIELSENRAQAVKEQLVSRGIEGNRIETMGLGSMNPISTNNTEEGRALNHRIDFVILKTE